MVHMKIPPGQYAALLPPALHEKIAMAGGGADMHDKLPVRGAHRTPPRPACKGLWKPVAPVLEGEDQSGLPKVRRPISLLPDILLTRGDTFSRRCLRPTSQVCSRDQLGPDGLLTASGICPLERFITLPSGPVGDDDGRALAMVPSLGRDHLSDRQLHLPHRAQLPIIQAFDLNCHAQTRTPLRRAFSPVCGAFATYRPEREMTKLYVGLDNDPQRLSSPRRYSQQ